VVVEDRCEEVLDVDEAGQLRRESPVPDVENATLAPSLAVNSRRAARSWRRATMATTELQAIVRFRFHNGDVEEFKRLSAQCMEIVRSQDTGTLQYDTYFNDDETECIVIERFRDSDALIQHGENLAHLMDAITATGSVSGELLGDLSAELRARFTGGGPVQLFTPWSRM
jgi:quinol monooxygenase YgiN